MAITVGLMLCIWASALDTKTCFLARIGIGGRLNKLPNCSPGDLVLCSVKKGAVSLARIGEHVLCSRQA